jgi:hypothetical protein
VGLGGVCGICEHCEEIYATIWLVLGGLGVVKRLGRRRVRAWRVVGGKTGCAALCGWSGRRRRARVGTSQEGIKNMHWLRGGRPRGQRRVDNVRRRRRTVLRCGVGRGHGRRGEAGLSRRRRRISRKITQHTTVAPVKARNSESQAARRPHGHRVFNPTKPFATRANQVTSLDNNVHYSLSSYAILLIMQPKGMATVPATSSPQSPRRILAGQCKHRKEY